jgi:hypothetical protein
MNKYFEDFEIEEMILGMARVINEKRYLEDEVLRLKDYEKKYNDLVNLRFQEAQQHSANILNACLAGINMGKKSE